MDWAFLSIVNIRKLAQAADCQRVTNATAAEYATLVPVVMGGTNNSFRGSLASAPETKGEETDFIKMMYPKISQEVPTSEKQ